MNHKHTNIIIIVTIFITQVALAQEQTPIPTSPPPKTATPNQVITPIPNSQTINKSFTQADLAIITGNTQRPNGIVWYDNKLYTICSGDGTVYEIDAVTGETAQYIYGVRNAHTLIAQNTTNGLTLWIPDFELNSLILIQQGTTKSITTQLNGPWGIAQLNDDNFVITNLRGDSASIVDTTGNQREVITKLRSPSGTVIDGEYLYIANSGSSRRAIEWFHIDDVYDKNPIEADRDGRPLINGLQNVTGMVLGADGLLYFAYALGTRGVVGRINPEECTANGCSNDQVENIIYTELTAPLAGLTLSPDMRLFVHSMFSPDLYWVQLPVTGE